ncbi:MAG: sugar phosphate isomerase/epimerase [Planctomycetes bacterium]|nr:sugar phosphate isomerase/epimerase [Planctomycetota bacterium]
MRLGCCAGIDDVAVVKAAGFDFLEVTVTGVLRGLEPSSTWDATAPDPAKLALPIEAVNTLMAPGLPIVGPSRDRVALQDYIQRIAKRAERLGIQRLVFGSGGARKRPDGTDNDTALQHLIEFVKMTGDVCGHHGITLVIEHLNRGETNTLNSLAECRYVCEQADNPNVAMLVDSYHYGLEKEEPQAILDLEGTLRHVHVAEVTGRIQPGAHGPVRADSPAFDFDDFFCALRKIGYDERVSVECKWQPSLQEGAAACAKFLRQAWANAGSGECGA